MADTLTWGWHQSTPWPGYDETSQNNLNANGNGMSVDPAGYAEFTLHDTNDDGIIEDHDSGDGSAGSNLEYFMGPSGALYPQEIALYENSTAVIGGETYTGLDIEVSLFTDGTWGARILDWSIPPGTHHDYVESVTLGTWDGVEYSGNYVTSIDQMFVCFTGRTRIATPSGPRMARDLRPGDLVLTRDHGPRPLLWSGCRVVNGRGRHAPVRFLAGALGPHAMLEVSPQHRILLTGAMEGFAKARHLVDGDRILSAPRPAVRYVHLLFDRHEILDAEGLWCESLYPGPQARAMLSGPDWQAVCAALPRLRQDPESYGPLARPMIRRRELRNRSCRPSQAGVSDAGTNRCEIGAKSV